MLISQAILFSLVLSSGCEWRSCSFFAVPLLLAWAVRVGQMFLNSSEWGSVIGVFVVCFVFFQRRWRHCDFEFSGLIFQVVFNG